MGEITFVKIEIQRHRLIRSSANTKSSNQNTLLLYYINEGAAEIIIGKQSLYVRRGQYIVINHACAYNMLFPEPGVVTWAVLPRRWLSEFIPTPDDMVFRPPPSPAWGQALAALLDAVGPESLHQLPPLPASLPQQVASLLALAFFRPTGTPLKSSREMTLRRLRQDMRDRLYDHNLDPAAFAVQEGISKRTLHALFAAAGTSFRSELITMRLCRARDLLEDPRFAAKNVAEIALLAGFANTSHFCRRFREMFGRSPAAYRDGHRKG